MESKNNGTDNLFAKQKETQVENKLMGIKGERGMG